MTSVSARFGVSLFGPLLLALTVLVTQFTVTIQVNSPDEIFFGLSESSAADINFLVLSALALLATMIMAGLARVRLLADHELVVPISPASPVSTRALQSA